jgi:hypothetical protein
MLALRQLIVLTAVKPKSGRSRPLVKLKLYSSPIGNASKIDLTNQTPP